MNVLGIGDRASLDMSKNTAGNAGVEVTLQVPLGGSPFHPLRLNFFKVRLQPFAGCRSRCRTSWT